MPPSASPRLRPSERGETSWVTMVLLASLLAGGYLAVVWGQVYLLRYEAGVVVTEFSNKSIHNRDDEGLIQGMCHKLAGLATVKSPAGDGTIAMVPAVEVRPEDVTWERNVSVSPPTLHVAFVYTTSVYFPLLDRFTEKTFVVDRTQEIQPARW